MDYTALKSEINSDPTGIGYSSHVASGDDTGIADLLNAVGAGTIYVTSMERDEFLLAIASAYLTLPSLSSTIQSKWDRILGVIQAATTINISSSSVRTLLSTAVSDGVLQQSVVDSITQRTGSRAEVLFGSGTIISPSDVSFALRGVR